MAEDEAEEGPSADDVEPEAIELPEEEMVEGGTVARLIPKWDEQPGPQKNRCEVVKSGPGRGQRGQRG